RTGVQTCALPILAVPVPQHHGPVAAVQEPADLGRVRGVDLCDGLGRVLVRGPDSRPGDDARPGGVDMEEDRLRHLRAGLARIVASRAPLRGRVADSRRSLDAPGALCALSRELRLRRL